MGCTSSSLPAVSKPTPPSTAGPLSDVEIQARIEAPHKSQNLQIAGISARYAWTSQRGYYPDAIDKDNQDQYCIVEQFGLQTSPSQWSLFAVFDGHGKYGTSCAQFAKQKLPKHIEDGLFKGPSSAAAPDTALVKKALIEAHLITNSTMHSDKRFDDALSGTTAISVLFQDRTMFVSNVGDSRAIVVSVSRDGRLIAKALSNDQTPYRKDERERIKATGARVLSMDQIEGLAPAHENWADLQLGENIDEGGDPPRVWSPKGDYPGTAFTRSLGDRIAEEWGVNAEPEILVRTITSKDKYVIIASDGVFEFLTNQMVADEIMRHADPLVACQAVVSAAYNLWLQYEVRTDDITIIAIYIDEVHRSEEEKSVQSESSMAGARVLEAAQIQIQHELMNESDDTQSVAKPVRRTISREKRKQIIEAHDPSVDIEDADLTDEELLRMYVQRSEEDLDIIRTAIESNFLFQHLNESQRNQVMRLMVDVEVSAGDRIIRQGDQGDRFYLLRKGRLEVRVRQTGEDRSRQVTDGGDIRSYSSTAVSVAAPIEFEPDKDSLGHVVHVYESNTTSHPGFGELSLMYGKPRAASVIAQTDGGLWALDRRVFKSIVLRPKYVRRNVFRVLKNVELFKCLALVDMQRMVDLLSETSVPAGQIVVQAGVHSDAFYILTGGQCTLTLLAGESRTLKENDYFAETSLLGSGSSHESSSSVQCDKDCTLLYITRDEFQNAFGPLETIMELRLTSPGRLAPDSSTDSSQKIRFSDLKIDGIINSDALGPLLLGSVSAPSDSTRDVSIRSFLLSQIEVKSLQEQVVRFCSVCKALVAARDDISPIPKPLYFLADRNALHIVFDRPLVADLNEFTHSNACHSLVEDKRQTHMDSVRFVIASILCALEKLHGVGVIYRAIQPDSICIDASGRICMVDYRVSKVGMGTGRQGLRTFTICGVAEYLAPEQVAQIGHSFPVDLWSLGVLLYEMVVGLHPFSAFNEVATYSRISSYGSKAFPQLDFPLDVPADCVSFINALIVSAPEGRLGAAESSSGGSRGSKGGFEDIRSHAFLRTFGSSWDAIQHGTLVSPLLASARDEAVAVRSDGVTDDSLWASLAQPFTLEPAMEEWIAHLSF